MKKNHQNIFRYAVHSICGLLLLLLASCQKNAPLIKQPVIAEVFVTMISNVPDASFRLYMNDELVHDSLTHSNNGRKVFTMNADSTGHMRLLDRKTGQQLMDTTIDITGKYIDLVILQLQADQAPIVMKKPEEEVPDGFIQNAFLFTDPYLPATFDLNVYPVYQDYSTGPVLRLNGIQKGVLTEYNLMDLRPNANGAEFAIFLLEPIDRTTGTAYPIGNPYIAPVDGPPLTINRRPEEKWFINSWLAQPFEGQVYLSPFTLVQF
jgi:hypothetical protein